MSGYTAAMHDARRERQQTAAQLGETIAERDALRGILAAVWLYVDWRYVTRQLTTEQKNLWADAVDTGGEPGPKADRWWEQLPCGHTRAEAERSIRHELCGEVSDVV